MAFRRRRRFIRRRVIRRRPIRRRRLFRRRRSFPLRRSPMSRPFLLKRQSSWTRVVSYNIPGLIFTSTPSVFDTLLTFPLQNLDNTYNSFSFTPTLQMVPNYKELTDLFETYTLAGFKVSFRHMNAASSGVNVSSAFNSLTGNATYNSAGYLNRMTLYSVFDSDDSNLPPATSAGIDALRERGNSFRENILGIRPIKRYFRPRQLMNVATSLITSTPVPARTVRARRLSTSFVGVPHYCVKGILVGHASGATGQQANLSELEVLTTFYLVFRTLH